MEVDDTTVDLTEDEPKDAASCSSIPVHACYAPNPKRHKTYFAESEQCERQCQPAELRRTRKFSTPMHEPHTGRYLDFCRELNMPTSDSLRLVFLRSFRSKNYVGIRNIAPQSRYKTVVKPCHSSEKPKGVFLTLPVWARLCMPEMVDWVEAAITDAVNSSDMHDAQIPGPELVHMEDAFTTADGEHRAPLGCNKWVTVSVFKKNVYVGFREFYFSKFCGKTLPGRGINLSYFEWQTLVMYMPEVNEFISHL